MSFVFIGARLRLLQEQRPIEAEEEQYAKALFEAYADVFFWNEYGEIPEAFQEKRRTYYAVLWDRSEGAGLKLMFKNMPRVKSEARSMAELLT